AVDDVVVGQDQPGRGVDDEPGALRRLLQEPQVGVHVHDAGLDRLVDGLVVSTPGWSAAAARDIPAAAGPGAVRCCTARVAPTPAAADRAATTRNVSHLRNRPGAPFLAGGFPAAGFPAAGAGRSEGPCGRIWAPPSLLSPSCIPQPFCPESTLASRFPARREDQACR